MDKLYIIIPAYNEEENIISVIEEWYPVITDSGCSEDSKLVIVDDGSKDSTLKLARDEEKNRKKLIVLSKKNGGHGSSIQYGYRYALKNGADYIFQTDSDGQTLAKEFGAFWNARKDNDVIIGDRTKRGDGIPRKVISLCVKAVVGTIFHVFPQDINTPYRLMSKEALKDAIKYIPDDYNLTNVALTAIFAKKRVRLKYIPITFRARQGGTNSINIPKIIRLGIDAYSDLRGIAKKL